MIHPALPVVFVSLSLFRTEHPGKAKSNLINERDGGDSSFFVRGRKGAPNNLLNFIS